MTDRPLCPYCGPGKYTGLPGNACENCMNTGYLDQCPVCNGDCASANPPVAYCPMRSEPNNVVTFPGKLPPDELIYICSCGCQSFRIYPTGVIECANCGEHHTRHADGTPVGEWVKQLPDTPATADRDDAGTITIKATGSVDFARAMVLRKLTDWTKAGTVAMLIGYDNDGRGSHWAGINTEDQKQWVLRKLRELTALIEETKASE